MRMLDLLLALCGVGMNEVLMDGQADRCNTIAKSVAFQSLEIGTMIGCQRFLLGDVHLAMEDIQALDTYLRSLLNHGFNGHLFRFEMPIGVGGDPKFDPFPGCGLGVVFILFGSVEQGCAQASGSGYERAAV